ncbi:hypothetical protein ATCC90586_008115 [Pythium insidiosum]|nr:hypothetical protein ATCC90586_008115 [Pythium insidiosum]
MQLVRSPLDKTTLQCQCPPGFQRVESALFDVTHCVAPSRVATLSAKVNLNLATTISFATASGDGASVLSLESDLLQDAFLLAASECYFFRSERQIRYCQALGNLCVLQHLDPKAAPCALLDLIQRSGRMTTANGISGWFATLPFLSYATNAPSVLASTGIGMKMSFDETANSGTSDHLEFLLATYALNGTLKGFRRLTTELQFCQDPSAASSRGTATTSQLWARFGVSTTTTFTCDLASLPTSRDAMELHELYLVDRSRPEADGDKRFVPVPVQNLNYRDDRGLFPNRNMRRRDEEDDHLSHRFFLWDVVSGVRVGETRPRVYRYAQRITLTVRTQRDAVDAIQPPLLSLAYVDTQAPERVTATWQVVYASDSRRLESSAVAVLVVSLVLAALRVLLHTFTWQRRNTRNEEMALTAWHTLSQLLMSLLANGARACAAVLTLLSAYLLVFFKLQSTVFLLLPEWNPGLHAGERDAYAALRTLLPLAFACQLVTVLHRVYQQLRVQLVLLDWEKPRATTLDLDAASPQPVAAPVSVWRSILVANEWNELQTRRKTSLEATLLLLLMLLYGCDLRALALPVPNAQIPYLGQGAALAGDATLGVNPALRFGTVASLWLLVWLAQRLWKWLIYERFVVEPRHQTFIDLCTVAKVSCFLLDETYHGFYLHCRSPYPFADGSMRELVQQLQQEAAGLTVGRGLDSSLPDCQTFELFLTRKWKRKYLALYNAIHGQQRRPEDAGDDDAVAAKAAMRQPAPGRGMGIGGSAGFGGGGLNRRRPPGPGVQTLWQQTAGALASSTGLLATQTMVEGTGQLSAFLKAFIDNQDDQLRWRIYRMETCLSRFFGIPPDMAHTKQSFFLPDSDFRFCRVLFLGIENDLMLLNLLCFTAFDLWFESHAVSALATYLLEQILVRVRARYGSQSIAQHSLVDARFLI